MGQIFVAFSDNLNFNENNLCCYVDENRFFFVLCFAKEKGRKCKLERPLISRLFLLSAARLHCCAD